MNTRFLTLGISYLLLAAFPGSPEAKKIEPFSDAGTAFLQLADADFRSLRGGSHFLSLPDEPDATLNWLLVLYGLADTGEFLALIDAANSSDEGLPAGQGPEREASPDRAPLLGTSFAEMLYGDGHLPQATAATTAPPAVTGGDDAPGQSTVSTLPAAKDPGTRSETIPLTLLNPPPKVYLGEQSPATKQEPNQGKAPGATPAAAPHPVTLPPAAGRPSPPTAPPAGPPEFAGTGPDPQYSRYQPPAPAADRAHFPADDLAPAPAPVPEPATILLFATGIAGLAFHGRRRGAAGEQPPEEFQGNG